jgi:hypothetical protein
MRHVLAFVSLIAIAAPAAAQHQRHGQQAAAPPADAPQALTPP